jgi:uncharacterized SAM-binding protein YcdF (DUF218 family)
MIVSHRPGHRPWNEQRGGIFFRFLFLLFVIVFFLFLYVVRHPLLRLAGDYWVVDELPQTSDAIVMLGDDNYNGDRAARAAELFKSGIAPRVVASGRYMRPYASFADLEQHDLIDHGVPASAVVRFSHRADDTREEAIAISQLLSSRGWKRIIVVTSTYHTRRAQYICKRVFPTGALLRIVAARDSEYDPDHWWWTRQGVRIFFHEFVGMGVTVWEMRRNSVQTSDPGLLDTLRHTVGVL